MITEHGTGAGSITAGLFALLGLVSIDGWTTPSLYLLTLLIGFVMGFGTCWIASSYRHPTGKRKPRV